MEALEINSRPMAVGLLEMLWHFTAEFAPQGDIGKYSDGRIEGAMDWKGKPGKLLSALSTSGWVDRDEPTRLLVHDWEDHCDDSVRKKLKRAGLSFLKPTQKVTGQNPPLSDTVDGQRQPTKPSHAKPSHKPHAEYPATAAAIRERYPETGDDFVMRLTIAVGQKVAGLNGAVKGEPDDRIIAKAVKHCAKSSPNQTSAGLYLTTVPQCVASWLVAGEPVESPQGKPKYDEIFPDYKPDIAH